MIEILSRFFHCGFAFYFIPVKIPAQLKNPEQVRMKYSNTANDWLEALPLGNGFLGAMVFGGTHQERI